MGLARLVLVSVLATQLAACGIRPRSALPDMSAGRVITREEVAATEASTMWEALRRTVRFTEFDETSAGAPSRIHRRGFSSIVLTEDTPIYMDGVHIRDMDVLDALPATDIEIIQVLSGVHATTYFGTNAGDGVILIWTRAS